MAARERNGFTAWVQPSRSLLVSGASLRCPNCNSTHLKKVSLAYQEGLFYTDAHTRMYFVGFGSSGPDFMIGKATTRGLHQSALSKQLNPPVRWSYRKLIRWCVLLSLSIGWIVFYANTVRGKFFGGSVGSFDSHGSVFSHHLHSAVASHLEAQSLDLQTSLFQVGPFLPLPTLRRLDGAGIAAKVWLLRSLALSPFTDLDSSLDLSSVCLLFSPRRPLRTPLGLPER